MTLLGFKTINFNTFRLIFQKLCAACQDLPTLQFLSKSHYPFWSYCPFFIKCSRFWYFHLISQKLLEIEGKFKLQKCSACRDLQKVPTVENVWQLCEELFLLKCIFCWLSLLLVNQIIKGKQLYYKMWSSKS